MPACEICQEYAERRRKLVPFKPAEAKQLAGYVMACKECASACQDWVRLAKAHRTETPAKIAAMEKRCAAATRAALLAMKELDRLKVKLQGQQTKLAVVRARALDDPAALKAVLPSVPKAAPRPARGGRTGGRTGRKAGGRGATKKGPRPKK